MQNKTLLQLLDDASAKQVLNVLDNQLNAIFKVDRKYIVESDDEFSFKFNETLSTAFDKGLPNLQGDLYLDWSLTNPAQTSGGFKKVQLDLVSYFDDLIEPFFKPVDDLLRPVRTIQKVLTTNIPGLDAFGININLLSLAEVAGKSSIVETKPGESPFNKDLLDAINSFGEITSAIDSAQSTVAKLTDDRFAQPKVNRFIDLGEFSFSADGSISNPLPFSVSLFAQAEQKGLQFFKEIKSLTNNRFTLPFLETPTLAFNLLLGQPNVKLIEYTIPGMQASFKYKQKFPIPLPIPIPVFAQFGGTATFSSPGLTIGYDSFGITNDDPLNGFYVDGSKPVFNLSAGLMAGVSAGVERIAYAEGNADITGDVQFFLPGRDSQVRYGELLGVFNSGNFTAEGAVTAGLTVYAEHITLNPIKGLFGALTGDFEKLVDKYGPYQSPRVNIFEFGGSSNNSSSTPFQPKLATYNATTRELRLNMGSQSDRNKRNVSKEESNEEFTVNPDLSVSAFGQQEPHSNIAKVVAFADAGKDKIIISANV